MSTDVSNVLDRLMAASEFPRCETLAQWKDAYRALLADYPSSWASALAGGYRAGCVGFAFASGYQSALRALVPELAVDDFSALCATEKGGNHPRAIQTRLSAANEGLELVGEKSFVTGGTFADSLLVLAQDEAQQGDRPALKLVRVDRGLAGVVIKPMPALEFVPEVDHAAVIFDRVNCDASAVLPGDGYTDYVKPFRTIEDVHVGLALCAHLLGVSIGRCFSHEISELLLACITSHVALAVADPASAATHLALAGARRQMEQLLDPLESEWALLDKASFACWERDRALLKVAGTAREARTARAWERGAVR